MNTQELNKAVATKVFDLPTGETVVRYHATNVVVFNKNKIVLNSGGWQTTTTKKRMNQASEAFDLGFHVWQDNWGWLVGVPNGETVEFSDGLVIDRRKAAI